MTKLISLDEVCNIVGLKKSALYKRIAEGTFPKYIKIGRASRWSLVEVQDWVEKTISDGKAV